ncbi:hypothetical protein GW17_00026655 [Ensete ventricosum]|nr:hypothetical protein GW17_00026655 [Ensete ventricosum]
MELRNFTRLVIGICLWSPKDVGPSLVGDSAEPQLRDVSLSGSRFGYICGGGGVGEDDDVVVAATRVQLRGRPLLGRPLPGRRERLLRLVSALLRPFVRKYVPVSARVLMVGCGNADMQMDVRDMSFFDDESFDCVFDKGTKLRFKSYIRTLDSLMLDCNFVWILVWHGCSTQCLSDARRSEQVLVSSSFRLLRPGGIYMLITYGDPSVRIPHLNQQGCNWKIILYILRKCGSSEKIACKDLCQNFIIIAYAITALLQPGQDSKALEGIVHQGQSWNQSRLLRAASFRLVLFSKIQIRTTYMCVRRCIKELMPHYHIDIVLRCSTLLVASHIPKLLLLRKKKKRPQSR